MNWKLGIGSLIIVIFVGIAHGCTSMNAEVLVKVDPRIQWSEQPLTNLVSKIPSIYAPASKPKDLSLTEVLWQPRKSQIPDNFTLGNKILNDEVGYVQMIYGSSPQQLWIYSSEDIQTVSEVSEALRKYVRTNENITFSVNGTNEVSTQLLESQDKSAYAIAFSVDTVDIVAIWNQRPIDDVKQVLNSLTLLKPQDELTKNLEQEFIRAHTAP